MTQEEKAKAYDSIIEKANKMHYENCEACQICIEELIPELAKSEDVVIKEKIIATIHLYYGEPLEDEAKEMIAWLEKQGEQKPSTDFSDIRTWKYIVDAVLTEKEGIGQYLDSPFTEEIAKKLQKRFGNIEQKPADKVEPKFKNGQWIVWRDKCYKVNYNGCGYELVDQNGLSTSLEYGTIDENAHLWDITKDAKEGDVLVTKNKNIFIFKSISNCTIYDYCGLYWGNFMNFSATVNGRAAVQLPTDYVPATKEQRNALMKSIADAGYTFDFDKKELKKIEQKPAWSEEDENIKESIITGLEMLKDGASDQSLIALYNKKINWLKSLRPQSHWKPSDEDLIYLKRVAENYDFCDAERTALMNLYNDLKKL